jgi:hypothetical protein
MEAKEKARELYDKILKWQYNANMYIERNITSTSAKQCALIAVDEILELGLHDVGNYKDFKGIPCEWYISYWQEVKQEIEKL